MYVFCKLHLIAALMFATLDGINK